MSSLFSQIGAADSFTSGAWMLYGFSALGVVVAGWLLVRNVKNLVLKCLFMSVVVFLSGSMAQVIFDSGAEVWVPAIPYLGVDIAFKGMKHFDQLLPYLVISAAISLVVCSVVGVVGRSVLGKVQARKASNKQASAKP